MYKKSNIFFICLFILFFIVIGIFLIRSSNDTNTIQNRSSYKYKKFTLKDFLKGELQSNIEDATSDQLPLYNYFQVLYPTIKNNINCSYIDACNLDKNTYADMGNGLNLYKGYLVYNPIGEEELNTYDNYINKINYISSNVKSNFYLYYVNSDQNIRLDKYKKTDCDTYIRDRISIPSNHFSSLKINSFDDYSKYFLKLDHHFTNEGVYQEYNDLYKLLNLNNKIERANTICFTKNKVYGSKSKSLALENKLVEKMCVDEFNLPNYKITINGEESSYGATIEELKELDYISYATIYGADYAEIIIENDEALSNKSLLIYSNSFSNGVNKLLASHYKTTYVIDGRHTNGFNMINYINENNIDDVLIISSKILFNDDIEWGD